MKIFGVGQLIPSQADNKHIDLNRLLSALTRYTQISTVGIFLNKTLLSTDRRAKHERFKLATENETNSLCDRNYFTVVSTNDVSDNGNILDSGFVSKLKNVGTKDERPKARLVSQSNRDVNKPYLIHDSITIKYSSLGIIRQYIFFSISPKKSGRAEKHVSGT